MKWPFGFQPNEFGFHCSGRKMLFHKRCMPQILQQINIPHRRIQFYMYLYLVSLFVFFCMFLCLCLRLFLHICCSRTKCCSRLCATTISLFFVWLDINYSDSTQNFSTHIFQLQSFSALSYSRTQDAETQATGPGALY